MLLFEIVDVSVAIFDVSPLPSPPTAIPGWPFTFEFWSITLLLIVHTTVTFPNALQAIVTPAVSANGDMALPLFSMSKTPAPPPPEPGLGSATETLIARVPIRFDALAPLIELPVIVIGVPVEP